MQEQVEALKCLVNWLTHREQPFVERVLLPMQEQVEAPKCQHYCPYRYPITKYLSLGLVARSIAAVSSLMLLAFA